MPNEDKIEKYLDIHDKYQKFQTLKIKRKEKIMYILEKLATTEDENEVDTLFVELVCKWLPEYKENAREYRKAFIELNALYKS